MNLARWIRAAVLPVIGGLLLAGGLLLNPGTASAESISKQQAVPSDPEGNKACLECHSKNQTMTRNGEKMKNSGMICFSWMVFEHGYTGKPTLGWI